jgi:glycosyltransferase involved in cell wall biosynthesis
VSARSAEGALAPGGSPPSLDILVVNWQDRENPLSGGAETHLHEVFGRLVRWGHKVTLLCSGFEGAPRHTELDGLEIHRTGGRYSFAFQARRYFRRHLRHRPFDVIVEDLNKVPVFTPSWSDTPVVLLVHHLFGSTAFQEAHLPLATGTWLLERPIPRAFRGLPVIAVSESTKDDLVARGMDGARIAVVPNGIEIEEFAPAPPSEGGEEHERFEQPTALYLGRVKTYKRVDLPVRAIAALRDRGIPGRLLIAGRGDHVPELEALARELSLGEDRVRFVGYVDDAQKVELFRRSWVHVLTSPKEGWGIANLEAAACGTATVASDSPGLRDSVVDGRTGYLVRHGDVNALAARLEAVFTTPDLRDRLGEQALAFAQGFSWDASAQGVLQVLRRHVVGSRAAGLESSPSHNPERGH